jgi:hypothetical protein
MYTRYITPELPQLGPWTGVGLEYLTGFQPLDATPQNFTPPIRSSYSTKTSLAKDPRDKVFAFLNITQDGPQLCRQPPYELPCEDVYMNLTKAVIRSSQRLDIQLKVPRGWRSSTLPTWVLDLSTCCFDVCSRSYPLLPLTVVPSHTPHAQETHRAHPIFLICSYEGTRCRVLEVAGLSLGRVDGLGAVSDLGVNFDPAP